MFPEELPKNDWNYLDLHAMSDGRFELKIAQALISTRGCELQGDPQPISLFLCSFLPDLPRGLNWEVSLI